MFIYSLRDDLERGDSVVVVSVGQGQATSIYMREVHDPAWLGRQRHIGKGLEDVLDRTIRKLSNLIR